MKPSELRALLAPLPPIEGDPPAWVRDLAPDDLVVAARWLRMQLDGTAGLAPAAALSMRLRAVRARESEASICRPLFDEALEVLEAGADATRVATWSALVDAAEGADDNVGRARAWLDALVAISGGVPALEEELAPEVDPEVAEGPLTGAATPTLEARCRALVRAAQPAIADVGSSEEGRWGIDFGTAWSKTALRGPNGAVEEHALTSRVLPSIVAVERGGDRILFGPRAAEVSRAARDWNVSTSIKRFLVGKRIDVKGMPLTMTTERLAVLYVGWLLHDISRDTGMDLSATRLPGHLSYPVARVGEQPVLREFFAGGVVAPRTHYADWLRRAFRMAQLMAVTYRGMPWPESVSELLTVLQVWDLEEWSSRGAVSRRCGVISEPAAVIGDFTAASLPEGLTMHVDCGAGTTDVSIFWRRDERVYRVVEHSAVVGGDTVDVAIEAAVLSRHPDLEPYRSSIVTWAREVKPLLLSDGAVDFDPDVVLGLRGEIPSRVMRGDVAAGIKELGEGVRKVVDDAMLAAGDVLLRARPRGVVSWPVVSDLALVWFSGGSSAVPQVQEAIDRALQARGASAGSSLLKPPDAYAGWSADRYRTMSCAVGASRRELLTPEDLVPPRPPVVDALSAWDKDAR